MALIDEYKQAVQDVLDGNTKEPPRPSAFPDEQDMLAALYAAAAALFLSKEAPGGGGGVLVVKATFTETTMETTMTLDKTWQEIHDADVAFVVVTDPWGNLGSKESWLVSSVIEDFDNRYFVIVTNTEQEDVYECVATSKSGYPSCTVEKK